MTKQPEKPKVTQVEVGKVGQAFELLVFGANTTTRAGATLASRWERVHHKGLGMDVASCSRAEAMSLA
jgi:hypothetical protein